MRESSFMLWEVSNEVAFRLSGRSGDLPQATSIRTLSRHLSKPPMFPRFTPQSPPVSLHSTLPAMG